MTHCFVRPRNRSYSAIDAISPRRIKCLAILSSMMYIFLTGYKFGPAYGDRELVSHEAAMKALGAPNPARA